MGAANIRPAHFCAHCGGAYWWSWLDGQPVAVAIDAATGAVTDRPHRCEGAG